MGQRCLLIKGILVFLEAAKTLVHVDTVHCAAGLCPTLVSLRLHRVPGLASGGPPWLLGAQVTPFPAWDFSLSH